MAARKDRSLDVYNSAEVSQFYVNRHGLWPCESYTFEKYIQAGASILDVGVGGGRTTPYLSVKASRYLGIDYAISMIQGCQTKFPDIEFRCEDATNLAFIPDHAFDVVVFSANGMGSIPTNEERYKCLAEVFRVLKPEGIFIFSVLNSKHIGKWPLLDGADVARRLWRILLSIKITAEWAADRLFAKPFYKGEGFRLYPYVHGGLRMFTSTPPMIERKLNSIGFKLIDVIQHEYPKSLPKLFVGTYYYVALNP